MRRTGIDSITGDTVSFETGFAGTRVDAGTSLLAQCILIARLFQTVVNLFTHIFEAFLLLVSRNAGTFVFARTGLTTDTVFIARIDGTSIDLITRNTIALISVETRTFVGTRTSL